MSDRSRRPGSWLAHLRAQAGFSLIELAVVVTAGAILALAAGGALSTQMNIGRVRTANLQAKRIAAAFNNYYNEQNAYPDAPAAGTSVAEVYTYFFGDDTTGASNQGILTKYSPKIITSLADSSFVPVAYAVTNGGALTAPANELVVEVKNVTRDERFIHIAPTGVSINDAATASVAGATGSWTRP